MGIVLIPWANRRFSRVTRIVLNKDVEEAADIRELARGLEIPVVEDSVAPCANDLWVGCSPKGGWDDLEEKTLWARTSEGFTIVHRLPAAQVLTLDELRGAAAVLSSRKATTLKDASADELVELLNGPS